MNCSNHIGAGQHKYIMALSKTRVGWRQTNAMIVIFGESKALNHGTHGAIEHHNALSERREYVGLVSNLHDLLV